MTISSTDGVIAALALKKTENERKTTNWINQSKKIRLFA